MTDSSPNKLAAVDAAIAFLCNVGGAWAAVPERHRSARRFLEHMKTVALYLVASGAALPLGR